MVLSRTKIVMYNFWHNSHADQTPIYRHWFYTKSDFTHLINILTHIKTIIFAYQTMMFMSFSISKPIIKPSLKPSFSIWNPYQPIFKPSFFHIKTIQNRYIKPSQKKQYIYIYMCLICIFPQKCLSFPADSIHLAPVHPDPHSRCDPKSQGSSNPGPRRRSMASIGGSMGGTPLMVG